MKPRDNKGRYVKTSSQTYSDIFVSKTPTTTNPRERYSCKKVEESSTQKDVKLQNIFCWIGDWTRGNWYQSKWIVTIFRATTKILTFTNKGRS